MPQAKGYSHATIRKNIAALLASGNERDYAVAAAYRSARVAFFRRFPSGALPQYLVYARCGRTREHYTQTGAPLTRNPMKRKIKQAAKLIADFSGHKARELGRFPFPNNPGVAIAIGNVLGISYETKRDGVVEKYYHRFTRKHSRPLLVSSHDGKQLFLIGGSYNFTERGIVDD
jgi:hypothetical protein